jgi:hypothetical protein
MPDNRQAYGFLAMQWGSRCGFSAPVKAVILRCASSDGDLIEIAKLTRTRLVREPA